LFPRHAILLYSFFFPLPHDAFPYFLTHFLSLTYGAHSICGPFLNCLTKLLCISHKYISPTPCVKVLYQIASSLWILLQPQECHRILSRLAEKGGREEDTLQYGACGAMQKLEEV